MQGGLGVSVWRKSLGVLAGMQSQGFPLNRVLVLSCFHGIGRGRFSYVNFTPQNLL